MSCDTTETAERLKELLKTGLTRTEAAERLKLPYAAVFKLTKNVKVKPYRRRRASDDQGDSVDIDLTATEPDDDGDDAFESNQMETADIDNLDGNDDEVRVHIGRILW